MLRIGGQLALRECVFDRQPPLCLCGEMVAFQHLILPPGAFRLLLALMVVVSHLTRFDIGRLAVLLFFFLSGYWTAQIWAAKFAGRDWKAFYASRWLRIAPLYLIAMGVFAVVLGVTPRLENLTLLGV